MTIPRKFEHDIKRAVRDCREGRSPRALKSLSALLAEERATLVDKSSPTGGERRKMSAVLMGLGDCYRHMGLTDAQFIPTAIQHYEEALALTPSSQPVHRALGRIYWSQKEFEKAQFHFTEAAKFKSPCKEEAEKRLRVIEARLSGAETNPESTGIRTPFTNAAEILLETEAMRREARSSNTGASVLLNNAYSMLQHCFETARNNEKPVILREMAACCIDQARLHEGTAPISLQNAQTLLTDAIAAAPEDAQAHAALVEVFIRLNEPSQAARHYKTACKLDPSLRNPGNWGKDMEGLVASQLRRSGRAPRIN